MIAIYSPHTVRNCSGDQNFKERHSYTDNPNASRRRAATRGRARTSTRAREPHTQTARHSWRSVFP
jgi:hypothetical protein